MITALIFALVASKAAPITIRVDSKPGDIVRGAKRFRVLVDTDETVNQVEFYVNGKLRTTDASSPYDFELNTLDEADGPVKVKFLAYTSLSHKAAKELDITINNEMSLGADAHVKRGAEALTIGKWDDAITEGRIAMKIKPNYTPARVVLARAYLGKGIIDEALNNTQEAVNAEPNNRDVLELQAGILLHQAFNTFNSGGSRDDTLHAIRESLSAAATARRKVLDMDVDAAKLDPTNPIPYADLAIKAGRYSLAISALTPAYTVDNRRVEVGNRLAYAQLRAVRLTDAQITVNLLMKYAKPDAYTYAVAGVLAYERGDIPASEDAMKQALLSDSSNTGVRTAQAYIALRRERNRSLNLLVKDLAGDEGNRSEVAYFLSALYNRGGDFANGRKYFEQALLAEPTNADVYIEQANRSIQIAHTGNLGGPDSKSPDATKEKAFQLQQAASYFEVARIAQPSSPQALTGLSIVAFIQGRNADALKYGGAAYAAGPEYTPGLYVYAGVLQKQIQALQAAATSNRQKANAESADVGAKMREDAAAWEQQSLDMIKLSQDLLIKAAKLDALTLGGRQAPTAAEAYTYYSRHGQTPIMTAP